MFKNKEVYALVGSIFLLAFIFGFDDGQEVFSFGYWISNFIVMMLFASIALLTREVFRKWYARLHDIDTEYSLWKSGRYWFHKEGEFKKSIKFGKKALINEFPVGAVLALILTIGSKGSIFFSAIGSVKYSAEKGKRAGRKGHLIKEWEEAKIALSASFASVFLIVLFFWLGRLFNRDFGAFIDMNFWILLFNLLPLPGLDGGTLLFKSRYLYVFGVVFCILSYFLLITGVIWSLVLSFLVALVAAAWYFWKNS